MTAARASAGQDAPDGVALAPLSRPFAPALFRLQNDWEVVRMLAEVPWPLSLADVEAIADCEGGAGRQRDDFVILDDGEPVGVGTVKHPGSGTPPRVMPRIGYWVGRLWWGQGIATAALTALVDHAFERFPHKVVGGGVFVDNPASRRVLEKLGCVRVGGYPTPCRSRGGEVMVDDMNLAREAWAARR